MKALLVGLGNMGRNHARILASVADTVSLVDPNYKSITDVPKVFNYCFDNIDAALKSNQYDFAVVAAPTNLHFEICQQLITNKTDLLVEKPITETLDSARLYMNWQWIMV